DGQAARSVGLKLSRASGNLVLGLTILGPDQQVAFQGILTQTDLVSDVTLPSTGEYVARIQKVELGPIPNPEDTAFRIEVTAH
ncbi:MAG: hypothetical protein KDD11_21305, partial [Acidobacteria bacterium]|nr:hypothetical protein [Acidobacteriota bacterium]